MTEGGEEGEAMQVHKDYQNHPYQSPILQSDQQQQIKEEALPTSNFKGLADGCDDGA